VARTRTGTLERRDGRWLVKLTVDLRGGGTERRTIELPSTLTEEQALKRRDSLAEKARNRLFEPREPVEAPGSELTFDTYLERWLKARIARGLRSVRKDRQRLTDFVKPLLGPKRMAAITADDLRGVVMALDQRIHDPSKRFAWKTASKVWGAVTKLFADAARSKDPELRVLRSNPCADLEGPDRGHAKALQWLYPNEFAKLVACPEVPLRWRRIYAVATYLYLRLSEVRALDWSDVDLAHGMVRVHRSTDERGRAVREHTKTGTVRAFRLEPTVRTLLEAMAREGGTGRVFGSVADPAGELRDHLERAGVKRTALHKPTETSLAIRFHDLRATGITWAALRGDSSLEIRDRAGHRDLEQTNDYMRRASAAGDVGEPFPWLGSLFDSVPGIVPEVGGPQENTVDLQCEGGDLKTRDGSERSDDAEKTDESEVGEDAEPPSIGARDNSGDNSNAASWALCLAAERVLTRRVFMVRGLRRRRRRRAG
jgi:integrase